MTLYSVSQAENKLIAGLEVRAKGRENFSDFCLNCSGLMVSMKPCIFRSILVSMLANGTVPFQCHSDTH